MIALGLDKTEKYITIDIYSSNFYETLNQIKSIPGAQFDSETKLWKVPRNKKMLKFIYKKFGKNKIGLRKNKYKLANIKEPKVKTGCDLMIDHLDGKINEYISKLKLDSMKLNLYSFQKLGVATVLFFYENVKRGFLIGDEMGLGKTAESLGIAHSLRKQEKIDKILVSCPKNVKYQWGHETKKFTNLKPIVVDGYNKQKRLECFDKKGDIYIINHDQLILNDDYKKIEQQINPDLIIVDEAHYFKNRTTKRTKALKKLSNKVSKYRLALTGTPMQNHPSDLHSIYEFLFDEFLTWKEFKERYILYNYKNSYPQEVGYRNLFNLKKTASKYMIRRLTEDVNDEMPESEIKYKRISMSKEQHKLHEIIGQKIDNFKLEESELKENEATDENDKEIEELEGKILGYMNIQSEIANDLRLLKKSDSFIIKKLLQNIEDEKIRMSPKTKEILKLINKILKENKDHKIVIFSKFATMVKMLKKNILNKQLSEEVAVIYGDLNEKQRDEEIQNFRNNPKCRIIVMSDAGCEGLNLENGSHLINYDLPWNPAILEQRNGRIKRIGSPWDKVFVYNLVSNNSIDSKIENTIKNKKETFDKIIENNDNQTKRLKEIADLII